jgi:carboxylesterase
MNQTMPGAEPFFLPGNPIGCLLVHGFTAAPQEMRELGAYLNKQGYTVLGIRLFGHGTRWQDLARSKWTDWMASVEDGYNLLKQTCDHIIPIGFSTGSILCLILASQVRFPAIVAMSTPSDLPEIPALQILYRVLPQLSFFIPAIKKGKPDWREPQALSARIQYDRYPLRAVYEFGQSVQALKRALPRVSSPLLLLHSSEDTFVRPRHSERIATSVGSGDVRTHLVSNSNHLITCDAARHEVFAITSAFIHEMLPA